jgi:hypothetical protein
MDLIAIAAQLRNEWKMLTIRRQENRRRRIVRVFELASDHKIPSEVLTEGAPGIFRAYNGERFLFHNDQLTQLCGAVS